MEYVSSDMKLLPYGMMNFEDIRLDNYYYVDKTSFIPLIERSDRYFFFIRPRRFGKMCIRDRSDTEYAATLL
mgnify:CR=1 FL=1